MQFTTALKWLVPSATLLGAAGIVFAWYSQDRFVGQPLEGPPIALLGARIYDPFGDSSIHNTTVIVDGREISAVAADAVIPDSAFVLSLQGLTLLPGFTDSHVHLTGTSGHRFGGVRDLGWIRYFWKFVHDFPGRRRDMIESGITSALSLGDPYPWVLQLAKRIERHELAGPRIFAAGPMFTAPGGHPVAGLRAAGRGDTSFIAQVTRQVAGQQEAVEALNGLGDGIDFISVVLESREVAGLPTLALSTLEGLTAAAHGRGLKVFAHVGTLSDAYDAVSAGVDGIEHLPLDGQFDETILAQMRERRIFVDPTLEALSQRLAENGPLTAANLRTARQNVLALLAAGIPVVVGSDAPSTGTYFGQTFHEELRGLVELGMTPSEAIAAATSVAAEKLGRSDRLGSLAPGKWADLIAVGGDPLSDILATADIYLVIADGQILVNRLSAIPRPDAVIAMGRTRAEPQAQRVAQNRVAGDPQW